MHADFSVELGRDDAAMELPWSSTDPAVRHYDLKSHPELLQQIPEVMAYPELGAFLARMNAAGFPLATAKCDAWQSREVDREEEIYGDRKFVSYVDLVFEDEKQRCLFEKHEAFAKDLCRLLSQTPEIPAAVEVVIRRCYYHGERGLNGAVDEAGAGVADATEVDERQSGVANREGGDRVDAGERTERQADVGHGMTYGDDADASQRAEADIDEGEAAGRLEIMAADEQRGSSGLDGSVSGFCFTVYVTGFGDSDHEPGLRWQIALALLQNAVVQLARE
jgi:hypothetical protein